METTPELIHDIVKNRAMNKQSMEIVICSILVMQQK